MEEISSNRSKLPCPDVDTQTRGIAAVKAFERRDPEWMCLATGETQSRANPSSHWYMDIARPVALPILGETTRASAGLCYAKPSIARLFVALSVRGLVSGTLHPSR